MKTIHSRLLALLMAVALLASLCACGQSDTAVTTTTADSATTTLADEVTTTVADGEPTDSVVTTTETDIPTATNGATTAATQATTATTTAATKDVWEGATKATTTVVATTVATTAKPSPMLNGVPLSDYTIVYGKNQPDYSRTAATYIQEQVKERTGLALTVCSDAEKQSAHEIVVGETNRAISRTLNADTEGTQFAILAQGDHVAMEAQYFVIAAAAYYFTENYIAPIGQNKQVPEKVSVHSPIVETPRNFIFLIGDGMGVNQTFLFEDMSAVAETDYSDGEDFFYGYLLPAQGHARTASLSGVTDSAAGSTALATGFKTYNQRLGRDGANNAVPSLTEIAGDLGKATAIMTTEDPTGATPSGFSVHVDGRYEAALIEQGQTELKNKYDTLFFCGYDLYTKSGFSAIERKLNYYLDKLNADPDGFFLMYEEAHIDSGGHSKDLQLGFRAVVRFNQAIATFMEFAFYHPDTFLIITADHETGALKKVNGKFAYTSDSHSGVDVPVFAYGKGSEVFNGKTVENVQIPKTIAAMWGKTIIGTDNTKYPSLISVK